MINFRLIRHLWLFLAVAEEQHFGRAARRLGMTQPPLTAQIQVLESALKVRLFDRSRQGARLTPAGQAILPAVRKLAAQLERLEWAVQEARSGQSGVLTVGAITSAMLDVLPPLIEQWKADYPRITVSVREIDSGEAEPALMSGEIDLAFVRQYSKAGSDIHMLPLQREDLAVALPRRHALAGLAAVPLERLADEDFILFSRQYNPASFDALIACCQRHGFSPRILHEVRTVLAQVACVGCGQGVALVPLALRAMAPDNVVVLPLEGQESVVTLAAVWHAASGNPVVGSITAGLQADMAGGPVGPGY